MLYTSLPLAFLAGSALAADSLDTLRCGAGDPPDALLQVAKSMVKETAAEADRTLEVDTFFHVVTTEDSEGSVNDLMLGDQLDVLNADFGPHGISFNLISTDYTVNDDWATGLFDDEMKPQLRQGTYADLNLYFLSNLTNSILGLCQFPGNFEEGTLEYYTDGCDVLAGSLPGGNIANYNQGGSATHEVGHWFGLLHVFQGETCSGDGDSVDDTPQQKTATKGCPVSQDSCPDIGGLDSIHNFMDYGYDKCYTGFTDGQATRMYQMWDTYRAGS